MKEKILIQTKYLEKPYLISYKPIIFLLLLMHFTGFIGMKLKFSQAYFEFLTPFNLISASALLFIFHSNWTKNFILWCIFVAFSGFFIEVLGVYTQIIFGKYAYGKTLGIKFLDVPLLISLNWLMLTYIFCASLDFLDLPKLLKITFAALGMTLLDVLIEPMAIRHDLWHWFGQAIPLQNYVAWFIFSWLFSFLFFLIPFRKKNIVALGLLASQVMFFVLHWVF